MPVFFFHISSISKGSHYNQQGVGNKCSMNNGTNSAVNGSNQDAIVKLNIGGYKFVTTKATLFSHGENFFTALLKGSIPSLKDEGTKFL